jgi:hypothetical protein
MPKGQLGATTLADGKIYISITLPDSMVRAVFLHEYVHWLHVQAGWYIPKILKNGDQCALMGTEIEAYALGDKYLEEHGLPLPYPGQHPIIGYVEQCAVASR